MLKIEEFPGEILKSIVFLSKLVIFLVEEAIEDLISEGEIEYSGGVVMVPVRFTSPLFWIVKF